MTIGHATTTRRPDPAPDRLALYLNDHLAGATAGVGLAWRIADAQRDTEVGTTLRRCAEEIDEDRDTLLDLMRTLDVPVRRYKIGAGWAVERLGRLKPNGRLTRSPSATVIELETMRLGIEGKACGWQVLRNLAEHDRRIPPERLDTLLDRARTQADTLEHLRQRAAHTAFTRLVDEPDDSAGPA